VNQAQWLTLIILATWEAENCGLSPLQTGSSRDPGGDACLLSQAVQEAEIGKVAVPG
jgi:hypothetical protein